MGSRWGGFRSGRRLYTNIDLWSSMKSTSSAVEVAPTSSTDFDYTTAQGIWSLNSTYQFPKTPLSNGQAAYTVPGTYTWICPPGVTSVCVVCVGGGGGGLYYNTSGSTHTFAMNGGTGGGLGWKNNIPVVPGNPYTVVVGAGGVGGIYPTGSTSGGSSYFINTSTVAGFGGVLGTYNVSASGGGYVGDGGGNGGSVVNQIASGQGPCGGGGAGGYTGDGGSSTNTVGNPGAGGGGGSGVVDQLHVSGGGGGVGIYGQGNSGGILVGGSNGSNGRYALTLGFYNISGGLYGGGGGGLSSVYWGPVAGGLNGGGGAVRIIWGSGRAFPSTNTGDL